MNGFMHIYCWTLLFGVSLYVWFFIDGAVQVCMWTSQE